MNFPTFLRIKWYVTILVCYVRSVLEKLACDFARIIRYPTPEYNVFRSGIVYSVRVINTRLLNFFTSLEW